MGAKRDGDGVPTCDADAAQCHADVKPAPRQHRFTASSAVSHSRPHEVVHHGAFFVHVLTYC